MSNKKQAMVTCEVLRKGFIVGRKELPVGTRIDIPVDHVNRFAGKVRSLEDLKADRKKALSAPEIISLNEKIEALTEANADLTVQVEALTEANADLVAKAAK